MMSLKFQSTGKLDTIHTLLNELESNIKAQQVADDNEYSTTSSAYRSTIDEQSRIIDTTTVNIKNWRELLANKQDTLAQKKSQKLALEQERDNINNFLEQLAITRQQEVEAFKQRIEDQDAMIKGLDEVISIFSDEVKNNDNLDKEAAENIMTLLYQIRESLVASIREDTAAEEAAAQKYKDFVDQQNDRLRQIQQDLQVLEREIKALESEITALKNDIDLEVKKQTDAIQLKAKTEEALKTLTEKYEANKKVRNEQLALIVQVRNKLKENPSNVQQFLNAA